MLKASILFFAFILFLRPCQPLDISSEVFTHANGSRTRRDAETNSLIYGGEYARAFHTLWSTRQRQSLKERHVLWSLFGRSISNKVAHAAGSGKVQLKLCECERAVGSPNGLSCGKQGWFITSFERQGQWVRGVGSVPALVKPLPSSGVLFLVQLPLI